jgi:hypothetical protein
MGQTGTLAILRAAEKALRAVDITKAASDRAGHAVSGGLIARDLKKLREHGLAEQMPDKTWKAVPVVTRQTEGDAELELRRKAALGEGLKALVGSEGTPEERRQAAAGAAVQALAKPGRAKRPTYDAEGHRIDGKNCEKCHPTEAKPA